MPTMKGKGESGGSMSQRYRPASEYDDATLAQKREYWRTKKREQRARLPERRGRPKQGGKTQYTNTSAALNSSSSSSMAASTFPLQNNDESYKTANMSPALLSGNGVGGSSGEVGGRQKEKWLQTIKLNKVVPQFPAPSSISAKAVVVRNATVRCLSTGGAVSRPVTSSKPSGPLFNASSSVPLIRVTVPHQPPGRMNITNGRSAKATPQPCVSMQGAPVPKAQRKAQVPVCIQSKPLTVNVNTGMMLVSSPSAPRPLFLEDRVANTPPPTGKKSALVTTQRTKGIHYAQAITESEEERAAKRREQWRIKKREQRAKLAARLGKGTEQTQSAEAMPQRKLLQRTGQSGNKHLPSPSCLRGAGQRQCFPRVKTPFTSAGRLLRNARVTVTSCAVNKHTSIDVKMENLQPGAAKLTTIDLNQNQQVVQIKVEDPQEDKSTQTGVTPNPMFEQKPAVLIRRLPSSLYFSNASRGMSRCRTPRQRFLDAQKSFLSQRNTRGKSPSHASVFNTRNAPKTDPGETLEQTATRRREYWRIKKREQRAKLSAEAKARLKEKDSLTRRVRRYHNILEEMRRARAEACNALTQPMGSTLTHASETIGGFIKEDGTLTINIPPVPTGNKSHEKVHLLSNNNIITCPQHQPHTKLGSSPGDPIMVNRPPPPLRPTQVKPPFPLAGQSVNKPPRLLSIRPKSQLESTATTVTNPHMLSVQTPSQLILTHPQTRQHAASGVSAAGPTHLGGCVMKMAVSNSAPSLAAPSLDPELTEEERMAKKREYWRVKKREQRAARAARLRQGVLQARASAKLLRRKIQKFPPPQQVAAVNIIPSRNVLNHTGNSQPLNTSSITPQANQMKEERAPTPAVDLNSQSEQAICPNIKSPPSPPPPPPPPPAPPEPDPALNADSQATTLLAVASMKKLLEESLNTVTECTSEHTDAKTENVSCKSEVEACISEEEVKPDVSQLSLGDEEEAPIAADLTLQIKSWQADADTLVPACSPNPQNSPQTSNALQLPPSSSEAVPHPAEHSTQTPLRTSQDASDNSTLSSPCRAQRLFDKKMGHQHRCPPEPPKLRHLPSDQQQQRCQKDKSPLMRRQQQHVAARQSGMSSLQEKREYWKLMKRQQRARSKARQKERQGESIQAPTLVIINSAKQSPPTKPALQPKPSTATLTAVTSIPTVLVVSSTISNAGESADTLLVKPPISSISCSPSGEPNEMHDFSSASDPEGADAVTPLMDGTLLLVKNQKQATPGSSSNEPRVRKWMLKSPDAADVDSAPCLPALKPPDNPLSSINLRPIEPLGHSPNCISTFSPVKIPCTRPRSPQHGHTTPTKLPPISTMVPPKPVPGESEEEFLKRKREYWRVKKKEQRARKAIRDRELTQRRTCNNWRPILPLVQAPETQDSDQWMDSEESEQLMSASSDADVECFTYSSYTEPIEDESEVAFADYDDNDCEDGPVSDIVWRNRYLMDHDPLNQLLVCMVCGELQYSHSLEGVRAHIDEAHPDTLNLDAGERQCILEAWDEQVSQRERFFTTQLQQHGGSLAEADGD